MSGNLECSSAGDRRFSALYAWVKAFGKEMTIETHYQRVKHFRQESGVYYNMDTPDFNPKGKKVDIVYFKEPGLKVAPHFLTQWYKLLWWKYLKERPELITYAENFDTFTDRFRGKSVNCQADVIAQVVSKGLDSLKDDSAELWDILARAKKARKLSEQTRGM